MSACRCMAGRKTWISVERCAAAGRIVRTNLVWGVHLGTKRGKGSEVRLGYSQIVNPAYIVSKGNMSFAYAFRLAATKLPCQPHQEHPAGKLCRSSRPVARQLDWPVSLDDRSIDARIYSQAEITRDEIN